MKNLFISLEQKVKKVEEKPAVKEEEKVAVLKNTIVEPINDKTDA